MKRACACCGAAISNCMGFVLARDFLAFFAGEIPKTSVREICGKCGAVALFDPEKILSQLID